MIWKYNHAATVALRERPEPFTAYKVYKIERQRPRVLLSPQVAADRGPHTEIDSPGEKRIPDESLMFSDHLRREKGRKGPLTHVSTLCSRYDGHCPSVPGFYSFIREGDAETSAGQCRDPLVRCGSRCFVAVPVIIAPADVVATNGSHVVAAAITITPEAFEAAIARGETARRMARDARAAQASKATSSV